MATFTWNTGSGAFGTSGDWTPAGPPGALDTAVFGSGTGTISGAGTIATLQLNPGGPWTWTGTLTADNYTVNDTTTLSTGAVWTLVGTPASSNYIVIGSGSGGSGSLSVSGGASITSSQAANTTAYALYVGSGSASNATGVLTISGSGSSVNTGSNGAAVGEAGTGTLSVQSGASATFTSADSSQIAALAAGRNAGSSGTVNVQGSGSSLTASGFVYVGRGGTGALTVSGGATFTGGQAASNPGGSYSVDIGDASSLTASTIYYGGAGAAQVTTGSTLHSLGNLNLGLNGSTGSLTVDGSGSIADADGTIQVGGGTDRVGGKGTLTVQNGGTVRAGTPALGLAAIAIGSGMTGDSGTAVVTGVGSLLDANGYRLSIGTGSSTSSGAPTGAAGTLTISNGAHVLSGASYSNTEAALALGSYAGGTATLSIVGSGSELIANGEAVLGGTDSGSGVTAGGTGTASVTGGGLLQTGAMTIERGSSLTVDQSSTLTTPSITLNGGTASLANLTTSTAVSFGTGGTLDVGTVTGANTVGNFSFGDVIDFTGNTAVTMSGTTLSTTSGSITVAAPASGGTYQLISDGNGGTELSLTPQTIGVYRFFETTNGTHFYTSSQTEAAALINPSSSFYRADLTEETNGFGAYAQVAGDANEEQVYRFFDTVHGTEFLTASATEAQGLMNSSASTYRPDLTFEPTSSFYEDATKQPGDVAVYRFFDTTYGTHFYTGDQSEYAAITTPGGSGFRSDLTYEGVGFYAPAGSYHT